MAEHAKTIGVKLGEPLADYIFGFNPFELESFLEWMGEWGISRGLVLWILYLGLLSVLSMQIPNLPLFAAQWLIGTAPVWLLVALFLGSVRAWIWYVQAEFLATRKTMLLEVKMPREITKSPRAMELALSALNISSGEATGLDRVWEGKVRPYFSLELVSKGGEIHFYIWCWRDYRDIVEAMMYSYYPEVELYEVEDYASKFHFDPKVYTCHGTEYRKQTDMGIDGGDFRINAYPIKTYIDFQLDQDPDEENKVDPFAQVLEVLGSIRPDEQIWIQIVLRKSGNVGSAFHPSDQGKQWKTTTEKEVTLLREKSVFIPEKERAEELGRQARAAPSWRFNQMIESMERNLGKYPYEVGMRGLYISSGEFRGPIFTANRYLWRPFGNAQYGVYLRPRRWHNDFDWPWQDFGQLRWNNQTRRFLDAFRRRSFYFSPWVIPTNIMTNEELASIWHPPSSSARTPGLERIPATKASAPSNLPV